MEEEAEELSAAETSESLEWAGRKMKPPDKQKYENDMEKVTGRIKQLEAELRVLASHKSSEESVRAMRSEKQGHIERRSQIEKERQALSRDIEKKNSELTKIQSTLQGYKTENRIDDSIRKLEYQLKFTNFKLSEEKKIVAEIDSLKRSKKSLAIFTQMKREIDALRDKQRKMREERDCNYKSVTRIKQQEDEIRRKTQGEKARTEALRKEMNDLYDQKRLLNQEFKVSEKEYQQFMKDQRRRNKEMFIRKKQEEDRAYHRAMQEYVASREPYEDEKLLCSNLIALMQKHVPSDLQDIHSPAGSTSGESVDSLAQSFEKEGLVLLKKKEESLFCGVVKPRAAKRSKKDKKRTAQNKLIQHTPTTLSQFATLEIKAPPTSMEVPEAIQQLESKKQYYESLPPPSRPAFSLVSASLPPSDGSESQGSAAPSIVESAFTESIPSTPEVYSDNLHPGFPSLDPNADQSAARRMSHDSGACELEEDSDCSMDKMLTNFESSSLKDFAADREMFRNKDLYERITSTESNVSVESTDSSASSGGTVVENTSVESLSAVDAAGDHALIQEPVSALKGDHAIVDEDSFPLTKGDRSIVGESIPAYKKDPAVIHESLPPNTGDHTVIPNEASYSRAVTGDGKSDSILEQLSHTLQQAAINENEKTHARFPRRYPVFEGKIQTDPLSDKESCDKQEVVTTVPSVEQTGELNLSTAKTAEVSSSS